MCHCTHLCLSACLFVCSGYDEGGCPVKLTSVPQFLRVYSEHVTVHVCLKKDGASLNPCCGVHIGIVHLFISKWKDCHKPLLSSRLS